MTPFPAPRMKTLRMTMNPWNRPVTVSPALAPALAGMKALLAKMAKEKIAEVAAMKRK